MLKSAVRLLILALSILLFCQNTPSASPTNLDTRYSKLLRLFLESVPDNRLEELDQYENDFGPGAKSAYVDVERRRFTRPQGR
ncbi:unnamed protein product [Dicrocoelium dendriticum]|nr:unnamed protein product [Dicrocoelium dendriticum]